MDCGVIYRRCMSLHLEPMVIKKKSILLGFFFFFIMEELSGKNSALTWYHPKILIGILTYNNIGRLL